MIKENKFFENLDFSHERLPVGEYDLCVFTNCDFSNSRLSNIEFLECEFINCNLSNVEIENTAFKEVKFSECKIVGVDFSKCNQFLLEFYFEKCLLTYSVFYQLELKGIVFKDSNLQQVDFTESVLSKAKFLNCDLLKATFETTNLEGADLYSSFNYTLNPNLNKIKKAHFSKEGALGLLAAYKIKISN